MMVNENYTHLIAGLDRRNKMRIGYITDWNGATRKVEILDETISGKYVLRGTPREVTDAYGKAYMATASGELFLMRKQDVKEEVQ